TRVRVGARDSAEIGPGIVAAAKEQADAQDTRQEPGEIRCGRRRRGQQRSDCGGERSFCTRRQNEALRGGGGDKPGGDLRRLEKQKRKRSQGDAAAVQAATQLLAATGES